MAKHPVVCTSEVPWAASPNASPASVVPASSSTCPDNRCKHSEATARTSRFSELQRPKQHEKHVANKTPQRHGLILRHRDAEGVDDIAALRLDWISGEDYGIQAAARSHEANYKKQL